jgi:hypothetical protein
LHSASNLRKMPSVAPKWRSKRKKKSRGKRLKSCRTK